MPSVLDQAQPFADSTSGEGQYFSAFYKRHFAVTAPTSWGDLARDLPHFPPKRGDTRCPASAKNVSGVGRLGRTIGFLCRPSLLPHLPGVGESFRGGGSPICGRSGENAD